MSDKLQEPVNKYCWLWKKEGGRRGEKKGGRGHDSLEKV